MLTFSRAAYWATQLFPTIITKALGSLASFPAAGVAGLALGRRIGTFRSWMLPLRIIMTCSAKCKSVLYKASQFWVSTPRLNMMNFQPCRANTRQGGIATFTTSEPIPLKNSVDEGKIFWGFVVPLAHGPVSAPPIGIFLPNEIDMRADSRAASTVSCYQSWRGVKLCRTNGTNQKEIAPINRNISLTDVLAARLMVSHPFVAQFALARTPILSTPSSLNHHTERIT